MDGVCSDLEHQRCWGPMLVVLRSYGGARGGGAVVDARAAGEKRVVCVFSKARRERK